MKYGSLILRFDFRRFYFWFQLLEFLTCFVLFSGFFFSIAAFLRIAFFYLDHSWKGWQL